MQHRPFRSEAILVLLIASMAGIRADVPLDAQQAIPSIILDDQTFEVALPSGIRAAERQVISALAELGLRIPPDQRRATDGGVSIHSGDDTRIVQLELVRLSSGATRIRIDAFRISQMPQTDFIRDLKLARRIAEEIAASG